MTATTSPAPAIGRFWAAVLALLAVGIVVVPRIVASPADGVRSIYALGFLMVAGEVGGRLVSLVGLPKLTGYLAVGLAAGPYGLAVFDQTAARPLTLINGLALALIALQAGAELTAEVIHRSARSALISTFAQSLIQPLAMTAVFAVLFSTLAFGAELGIVQLLAIGGLWAAIALSKSPAATLAVLGETGARGPVSEHVLAVVVILDVLVLALFSLAVAIARANLISGTEFSAAELATLGGELFASIAAGTTFGLLLALALRLARREHLLLIVAAGYGITALCDYLHYDTLLVFVTAGMVVTNLTKQGPALIAGCSRLSAAVMVVFFATAGAKLDLGVLASAWPIAITLVGTRILFTVISCRVGHRLAGDGPEVERYAWLGFVSQAGVTIALVAIAAEQLPDFAAPLTTLGIAVVGINELVGPVLFKLGLSRAGEIPASRAAQEVSR